MDVKKYVQQNMNRILARASWLSFCLFGLTLLVAHTTGTFPTKVVLAFLSDCDSPAYLAAFLALGCRLEEEEDEALPFFRRIDSCTSG